MQTVGIKKLSISSHIKSKQSSHPLHKTIFFNIVRILKMVSVSDAVDTRKSVRKFLPDAVDLSTVRSLLERASRSPSGGNTQPWHVYVVANDRKDRLGELVENRFEEGEFSEPPEFHIYPKPDQSAEYMKRRRKLGYDMYELMGIKRDDQMGRLNALKENFHFFGAPVGIIVTVDRIVDRNGWGHVGMFLQSFCLLAIEEGLTTCLQEAWSNFPRLLTKELDIPEGEMVWCGIALGKEDTTAKVNELRSERVAVDAFARFAGFDSKL